jgi:3-phosphoshikimate 1-carboxyvinyltransferase
MTMTRARKSLRGTVAIPASKPDTQRALLLSALADGVSRIRRVNVCSESLLLREACGELGARFSDFRDAGGDGIEVTGTGGRPARPATVLRTADSGYALRHLTAVAALVDGPCVITGGRGLAARPIAPLVESLSALGARLESADPALVLPLVVWSGELAGGAVRVPAAETSQFASAVMLVAPYAAAPVTITLPPPVVGAGYIRLTAQLMRRFGARVTTAPDLSRVVVEPGGYRGTDLTVGPDATSLFYFLAAAVVTDTDILVTDVTLGADPFVDTVVALGRRLGVRVTQAGSDIRIASGPPPAGLTKIDAAAVPTLIPALAAIAGDLPGGMLLRGARHVRHHKTSRLATVLAELAVLRRPLRPVFDGQELDGFETAEPPERPAPLASLDGAAAGRPAFRVDSHGDHRNFMALYLAALTLSEPVEIAGEQTLATSFADFVGCFESLSLTRPTRPARQQIGSHP